MIRKAFVMQVNPDQHEEYERRHNPIWPKLEAAIKAHGVTSYSIFLDAETSQLFAYAEVEDEAQWASIAEEEICQKWWTHMKPLMASNPDDTPIVKDVREVFHIE
jgi:L-rhamnose mutarotase